MPRSPLRIGACLLACLGSARAQEPQNNAGFGGIYRTVDLGAATGNEAHLGCADVAGKIFVTARDPLGGTAHVLYVLAHNGTLLQTLPQPGIHTASAWGMRDLCSDGTNLAGGSEAGISILTPAGTLAATWNGQPITQPIGGAALAALGVPRGLAWNGAAAGGAGRFYAVNFDSPIYEFDVLGNITGTFANKGWSGAGLAFDAVTGNLWIDACPSRGGIAELALGVSTWEPTGRFLDRARPGAFAGGLSEADPTVGAHAPWASRFLLLDINQDARDTLAVHRVDLWPGRRGHDEDRLDTAVNGGPLDGSLKKFGGLDTLVLQVTDPTGARTGLPCWTLFNFPPESHTDDITDLTLLGLGIGIAPEHRTHNELSIGAPAITGMLLPMTIGTPVSLYVGPSIVIPPDFLVRAQSVSLDLGAPHLVTSTDEVHLLGNQAQSGVVVEAVGPSSFARDPKRGFWRIAHGGGYPAIRSVRLSWSGTTVPGQQSMVFDIDQDLDGRRHDAGNSALAACTGTWRNGSDITTGLDYAFAGNHRAACSIAPANAGFTIDGLDPTSTPALTYHFAGGQFTAGKCLEFDCDTDGGLGVAGDAMRGLSVVLTFVDNSTRSGVLAVDPQAPQRAFVRL